MKMVVRKMGSENVGSRSHPVVVSDVNNIELSCSNQWSVLQHGYQCTSKNLNWFCYNNSQ
jgi:hypothetical protein